MDTPFGEATQVDTALFIRELLPSIHPSIHFGDFCTDVETGNHKRLVAKNGHLWGYSAKTPSAQKSRDAAFRGLQHCVGRLTRAFKNIQPSLDFKNNRKAEWSLKGRSVDSLPDAYLLLKTQQPGTPPDWTDIAVPGVYSKTQVNRDEEENVIKITRCLSQCMHRDARRRFVYGFTIEDCSMRLWYCDRRQIVASELFNFITDWRTLFHFLLRVIFADYEALGFDPSIGLIRDGLHEGTRYTITVRSTDGDEETYRTAKIISDSNPRSILGRGTRVWEVIKIEDGVEVGKTVVLKDSWIDSSRTREGTIRTKIQESATSEKQRVGLDKVLLTVLIHGDVHIGQSPDLTKPEVTNATPETPRTDFTDRRETSNTPLRRQVHYRIVYEEVCQPLQTATSLFTVFKALGDTANALRALHESGWVHHDVSMGNILLFGDNVKLADLEYAERLDTIHDHKKGHIGTRFFMAVEVKVGSYMFLPVPNIRSSPDIPDIDVGKILAENSERMRRGEYPLPASNNETETKTDDPKIHVPDFYYNHMHDLESLWWIAAFFVIHQVPDAEDKDLARQQQSARDLFWKGSKRFDVMFNNFFGQEVLALHSSLREIGQHVEDGRRALVRGYRRLEAKLQDPQVDAAVHNTLIRSFWRIAVPLKENDIPLCPLPITTDSQSY